MIQSTNTCSAPINALLFSHTIHKKKSRFQARCLTLQPVARRNTKRTGSIAQHQTHPLPVLVAAAHDGGGEAELLADGPGLGGAGAQQLVLCRDNGQLRTAAPHGGSRSAPSPAHTPVGPAHSNRPRPFRPLAPPSPQTSSGRSPTPSRPSTMTANCCRSSAPCEPVPPPVPHRLYPHAPHLLPVPAAIFPARPERDGAELPAQPAGSRARPSPRAQAPPIRPQHGI